MGNICDPVCSCSQCCADDLPKQLHRQEIVIDQPKPVEVKKERKLKTVVHQPQIHYIDEPIEVIEITTQDYGDGPHPRTAKRSKMPPLTNEQKEVLKRELPLREEGKIRGTPLQCFFLTNKRIWYEGEWVKGLPNGKGKAIFESGMYYEGIFQQGYGQSVDGIAVFPEGSYYRGNIANSKLEGKGIYYNAYSKNTYRGDWMNDKPQGMGTEQFINGNKYEGQFKDGYKSGKGKFTWRNGMTYEGDFLFGYMWGQGTLKKGNAMFQGQFQRGKKIGQNVSLRTETGEYKGSLNQGLMNGNGQFLWNDKKRYNGGFQDGNLHGKGEIVYPNGQKVTGTWDKGLNMEIDRITRA